MELFIVDEMVVYPSTDALLIPIIGDVARRDIRELAYVYFMVSPRASNPFHLHSPDQKHQSVCNMVMHDPDYKPDELVNKAMFLYRDLLSKSSPSMLLLESALSAIHKTNQYYQNLDYNEKDRSGKAIHKPKEVLQSIQEIEATGANLSKLKERVNKELEDSEKKQRTLPTEDPAYLESIINQWEELQQTNQQINYDKKTQEGSEDDFDGEEQDSDAWFEIED